MKISKSWLYATLSSFVATVLGIILTFGASKIADKNNERELQKQCVFNALNDIENVMANLKRDSLYIVSWYPDLPDYVERHANRVEVPADTVASIFLYSYTTPSVFLSRYKPVGQPIIESVPPTDAFDMQLHRIIALAYSTEDKIISFEDKFFEFYDKVLAISTKIQYSTKVYNTQEIIDAFLDDPTVQEYSVILKKVCENNFIGSYMEALNFFRKRILQFSDISEEEYQAFKQMIEQKQKVAE